MSERDSPYFAAGCADGARDAEQLSQCPPGMAAGPDPSRAWSVMYGRGYDRTCWPQPCPCDGSCKRGKQLGQAPDNRPGESETWGGAVEINGGGVDIWA